MIANKDAAYYSKIKTILPLVSDPELKTEDIKSLFQNDMLLFLDTVAEVEDKGLQAARILNSGFFKTTTDAIESYVASKQFVRGYQVDHPEKLEDVLYAIPDVTSDGIKCKIKVLKANTSIEPPDTVFLLDLLPLLTDDFIELANSDQILKNVVIKTLNQYLNTNERSFYIPIGPYEYLFDSLNFGKNCSATAVKNLNMLIRFYVPFNIKEEDKAPTLIFKLDPLLNEKNAPWWPDVKHKMQTLIDLGVNPILTPDIIETFFIKEQIQESFELPTLGD